MAVVEGGDRRVEAPVIGKDRPPSGSPGVLFGRTSRPLPREVRASSLDLRIEPAVLSFPEKAKPAAPTTSSARAFQLPASAFVSIGPRLERPRGEQARFAKRGPSASANDNLATPSPAARSVWRDLFFLAVLAATVVGAFWSGRVHGLQRIIVVPDAPSFSSVVT